MLDHLSTQFIIIMRIINTFCDQGGNSTRSGFIRGNNDSNKHERWSFKKFLDQCAQGQQNATSWKKSLLIMSRREILRGKCLNSMRRSVIVPQLVSC